MNRLEGRVSHDQKERKRIGFVQLVFGRSHVPLNSLYIYQTEAALCRTIVPIYSELILFTLKPTQDPGWTSNSKRLSPFDPSVRSRDNSTYPPVVSNPPGPQGGGVTRPPTPADPQLSASVPLPATKT